MANILSNLSRPGEPPQEGDWVQVQAGNGTAEKQYHDPNDTGGEDLEVNGRLWRDQELKASDWIVPLTDHPQHAAYMTYRQALRDWPSTTDFPDARPELGA